MESTRKATYYEVLEVSPEAEVGEIRRAYRRLAQAAHPDADGGSAERFVEINDAYQTLMDPDRRRVYDAYLRGLTMIRSSTGPAGTTMDGSVSAQAMFFDSPEVAAEESASSRRSARRQGGWRRLISSGAARSH